MKVFLLLAICAVGSLALKVVEGSQGPLNGVYGYLKNYGIPEAERIRAAEAQLLESSRIVGGVPAAPEQYPYQAGLLIDLIGFDSTAVCGGSLVSADRVVTAAHCWFDGRHQAWRFTVVLGSSTLFSGGVRLASTVVALHPSWDPSRIVNDIAVIYLPNSVPFSNTISPVTLPSGPILQELFVGESAIASGYGLTSDGGSISSNQFLSHVNLTVITNSACSLAFPLTLNEGHLCTSGVGGIGTCRGDSGGPLVITRNNERILIGVTSFGSALGCQVNRPSAFTRVTSQFIFLWQHVQ